jgi:hypothetical protein
MWAAPTMLVATATRSSARTASSASASSGRKPTSKRRRPGPLTAGSMKQPVLPDRGQIMSLVTHLNARMGVAEWAVTRTPARRGTTDPGGYLRGYKCNDLFAGHRPIWPMTCNFLARSEGLEPPTS